MKRTDYIQIQAPMVTDLGLKGNKLLIFALIHGFCKDGNHVFTGSLDYIRQWVNVSKPTIITSLKELVDDGYINKFEDYKNDVKFCYYTTNYDELIERFAEDLTSGKEILPPCKKFKQGGKEILLGGGKEILPNNNILDNNNDNNRVKRTLEDRRNDFISELNSFRNLYTHDMLLAFFEYWSELNPSKTKMRFELQKTWETSRRLATWQRNERPTKKPQYTHEEILEMIETEKEMNHYTYNDYLKTHQQ